MKNVKSMPTRRFKINIFFYIDFHRILEATLVDWGPKLRTQKQIPIVFFPVCVPEASKRRSSTTESIAVLERKLQIQEKRSRACSYGRPHATARSDELRRMALTMGPEPVMRDANRRREILRRKNDRAIASSLESLLAGDQLMSRLRKHRAEVSRLERGDAHNIARPRDEPEEPCTATPGPGSGWGLPPASSQRSGGRPGRRRRRRSRRAP